MIQQCASICDVAVHGWRVPAKSENLRNAWARHWATARQWAMSCLIRRQWSECCRMRMTASRYSDPPFWIGLTTVPYTATAVRNTVLYGYGPYRKRAVPTKSKPTTVRRRLQTAVLRYFTVVRAENLFKTLCTEANYICNHIKHILDSHQSPEMSWMVPWARRRCCLTNMRAWIVWGLVCTSQWDSIMCSS